MKKIDFSKIFEGAKACVTSRRFLEGWLGVAFILVISLLFFSTSLGESLRQNDMLQGAANGQEAKAFYEETGEKTCWTNSLFGGMPTFQIAPSYESTSWISTVQKIYTLGLPSPVSLLFMMMVGFYILMLALKQRWYVALLGAIAYAFSSYFIIIIGAGHIWKFYVLSYIPPTIAGIILCYRGKLLAGGAMTALFGMMQIVSNHVQMTYYFLFLVAAMMVAFLIDAYIKKTVKLWLKATGVLFVAGMLAIAANITSLYNTYEYSKQTIRGRSSDLTPVQSEKRGANVNSKGIDRDQVTSWSYGGDEMLSLIVPNIKGGATVKPNDVDDSGGLVRATMADENLQTAEIVENATITGDESIDVNLRPQLNDFASQFSQYFGNQPMTNGPVYVGALIFALFIFGLFVVKNGPLKWAMFAGVIISLCFALGHNFPALNYWMIDNFPMFDKFRAPASALVVAELAIPLIAALAIGEIIEDKNIVKEKRTALFYASIAFGISAIICLLLALFPGMFGSLSVYEAEDLKMISAETMGMEQAFYLKAFDVVQEARKAMISADALRSLMFIALGFALIYCFLRGYIKEKVFAFAMVVVVAFDLMQVDKRYLNEGMFVDEEPDLSLAFIPTEADTQILKDKSYYRVMNVTAFGSATPSYFHHSLGGYHAAKLTRFNDLQAKMIDVEKNELIAAIKSDDFNIDSISTPALNMMNTKYFMFGDRFVLENPHALGAVWFVDKIDYVKGADAEMATLKSINPAVEAVADESYRKILGSAKSKSAGDTIYLTSYKPNELQYKAVSNAGNVAVFSEVFFPWGWYAYIDGKPAEIGRVDYTLRAMAIPSGSHDIVMRFDPKSIHTTEIVAYTSILIIYFAVALAIIAFLMNYYKKDE